MSRSWSHSGDEGGFVMGLVGVRFEGSRGRAVQNKGCVVVMREHFEMFWEEREERS